jgi:hypothetical protein
VDEGCRRTGELEGARVRRTRARDKEEGFEGVSGGKEARVDMPRLRCGREMLVVVLAVSAATCLEDGGWEDRGSGVEWSGVWTGEAVGCASS